VIVLFIRHLDWQRLLDGPVRHIASGKTLRTLQSMSKRRSASRVSTPNDVDADADPCSSRPIEVMLRGKQTLRQVSVWWVLW
jgi:hypothetical protein